MSAARLVSEFGAQDVGAWLSVFGGGKHTRVAAWNNANGAWDILPAGHEMLNVAEEPAEPLVQEAPPVVRRKKVAAVVEQPGGLFPSDE